MDRRQFLNTSAGLSLAAVTASLGQNRALVSDGPPVKELEPERKKAVERKIREARDVALDILKPSKKQIEHGLELHKNSLVVESYGFSPRAAIRRGPS